MSAREQVVSALARHVASITADHPLRVGVDGVCGSGKSTLASELTRAIGGLGRPAVHLDSDGFHNLREIRYRQGRDSARGYYDDAYDFEALVDRVLLPLGSARSCVYATKVHDMGTDQVVTDSVATAPRDAIVIFDCTFLQRGRLRDSWDVVIYLDVRRETALARGVARDTTALGGVDLAHQAYDDRYMAACDIYIREEHPSQRADIVIDHDDVEAPRVVRGLEVRELS